MSPPDMSNIKNQRSFAKINSLYFSHYYIEISVSNESTEQSSMPYNPSDYTQAFVILKRMLFTMFCLRIC